MKNNENKKNIILFILLIAIYLLLIYNFKYNTTLQQSFEINEGGRYWYVQMAKLLLNQPTDLHYPIYRIFSPALALGISAIFNLTMLNSLFLLTVIFGILTIIFLYFYYPNLLKQNITLTATIIVLIYIFSLPILVHSISPLIEIQNFLFAFLIFYFTIKIFKKDSTVSFKHFIILIIIFILSMINKEQTLFLIPIVTFYFLKEKNFSLKIFKDKKIIYLVIILAICLGVYFFQNHYLFQQKLHLVEKANQVGNVFSIILNRLSDSLLKFSQPKLIIAFILSLGSVFGAFWIFIIASIYYKLKDLSLYTKKGRSELYFIIFLFLYCSANVILINIGFKYFFYILAPYMIYIGADYTIPFCKDVAKKFRIENYKKILYPLLLIFIFLNIILVYLYIWFHCTVSLCP